MPKNYTEDELKNGRWVTVNGAHVFIKDGESPEDVFNKATGKGTVNKKEGSPDKYDDDIPEVALPERIDKYTRMLKNNDLEEIAWKFTKDTYVNIDRDVIKTINPENLCMTMDTIADIKNKYDCTILTIKNATDDMIAKSPNAYAWMGQEGVMYLNPNYFGKTNERLELDWTHARADDTNYHPNSPYGARSIIAHEMGHAILNRYIENAMKQEDIQSDFNSWCNHWNACQRYATDKYGQHEVSVYRSSLAYKELVNKFEDMQDELNNDAYLNKRFGRRPNMSLLGFANPDYAFSDAISRYAGTNYHEMMAEAFVDVYDNGTKASFTSKFLYNKIIKGMKK